MKRTTHLIVPVVLASMFMFMVTANTNAANPAETPPTPPEATEVDDQGFLDTGPLRIEFVTQKTTLPKTAELSPFAKAVKSLKGVTDVTEKDGRVLVVKTETIDAPVTWQRTGFCSVNIQYDRITNLPLAQTPAPFRDLEVALTAEWLYLTHPLKPRKHWQPSVPKTKHVNAILKKQPAPTTVGLNR